MHLDGKNPVAARHPLQKGGKEKALPNFYLFYLRAFLLGPCSARLSSITGTEQGIEDGIEAA